MLPLTSLQVMIQIVKHPSNPEKMPGMPATESKDTLLPTPIHPKLTGATELLLLKSKVKRPPPRLHQDQ